MKTNLEKAKAIFMDFGGSKFGMGRECAFEEYRQYHIPAETELEWIQEYQKELLNRLDKKPNESDIVSQFSSSVSNYKNYDALGALVAFTKEKSKQLCSFSKLRYAEELYRNGTSLRVSTGWKLL